MMICTRCVMDSTAEEIQFDLQGECNFCKIHDRLAADYPKGKVGEEQFSRFLDEMRKKSKRFDYDCVVGVSGGTDSTYLIHLTKQMGLRPLAVNLDNGWHSKIAVSNIKSALEKLRVDLRTYVIDWEEVRHVLLSFMRAGLPWPDGTTDNAISKVLYQTAAENHVPYVFFGQDFRTEGKQPRNWTYVDGRLTRYLVKKFSGIKLKSFPNLTASDVVYYGGVRKIRFIRPFWYLPYHKGEARKLIQKELGWVDYGGHHHESIFTRFNIAYWLPQKFGMDKRKVTFSALIRSGEMTRPEAVATLAEPPASAEVIAHDIDYVCRKLEISPTELQKLMLAPNHSFQDYPSYFPAFSLVRGIAGRLLGKLLPTKPMMLYESA